jgi:outer membrane receptor protein involved in Fe transport
MPIINRALDNQTFNGWNSYGNPNLKPKLSVNYEFGVQQNLWDTHQLDIVTYYNDLKDQTSVKYIESKTGSQNRNSQYLTYDNNGYGNSRGVEITFKNRVVSDWRYSFSYTLSQTSIGYHGSYLESPDRTEDIEKYLYGGSDFLAPEDRTHRFNSSITYVIPEEGGPELCGIRPFSNTSIGMIYRLMSGLSYYYSPEFQYEYQVETNRRYPMESQTDLRIDKSIKVNRYRFKLGVRILNLLNNRHFTPISDSEELERWVLRSVSYMDRDYNFQGAEEQRAARVYNYFQTFKNIPRQVFIKLGISF